MAIRNWAVGRCTGHYVRGPYTAIACAAGKSPPTVAPLLDIPDVLSSIDSSSDDSGGGTLKAIGEVQFVRWREVLWEKLVLYPDVNCPERLLTQVPSCAVSARRAVIKHCEIP